MNTTLDEPTPRRPKRDRWLNSVVTAWALALVPGFGSLFVHASTAGASSESPARWPAASALPRPAGRPVVVMTVHPFCPCSRASLHELARLASDAHGRLDVRVLVAAPTGDADEARHSDNWRLASEIPNATVVLDTDGAEAHRFGGETSGATSFFDAGGTLRFHGGITSARGHEGDSAGRDAVLALLDRDGTRSNDVTTHTSTHDAPGATPVYGCPMHHATAAQR